MQHIGDRVRCAREKRGWGQRKLAEAASVSPGWVSMLEQQKHIGSFGLDPVRRVADALGVSLVWLCDGGDEPDWSGPDAAA